jgi:hypothetical protein
MEPRGLFGFVEALACVAGVMPKFADRPREDSSLGGHAFMCDVDFDEFLDQSPHTAVTKNRAGVGRHAGCSRLRGAVGAALDVRIDSRVTSAHPNG